MYPVFYCNALDNIEILMFYNRMLNSAESDSYYNLLVYISIFPRLQRVEIIEFDEERFTVKAIGYVT